MTDARYLISAFGAKTAQFGGAGPHAGSRNGGAYRHGGTHFVALGGIEGAVRKVAAFADDGRHTGDCGSNGVSGPTR
jgi:hypothetical protein